MKPESIIQADFLDILFDNRNKDYGAYILRKHYNDRLFKAIASTCVIAALFTLSTIIYKKFLAPKGSLVAFEQVTPVELKSLDIEKNKPEKTEIKKAATKPLKQIAHPTFKIVKDNEADKPISENKQMEDAQIGLVTTEGNDKTDDLPILSSIGGGGQDGKEIEPAKEEIKETGPMERAELMPEFPGGLDALTKYLVRNLREPDDLELGEKVIVMAKFVVQADGEIDNAEIINAKSRYDNEVLRVIRKMPKWKPGIQNGNKVAVYFTIPITFQRNEE